jgi:hypothetical protein
MAKCAGFLLLAIAAAAAAAPRAEAYRSLPLLPPLPPLPVIPVAAPPASCTDALQTMVPCFRFLTNRTITTPRQRCCDNLAIIMRNSSRICLCHVLRPDITNYTHAPVDLTRVLLLPSVCGIIPPIETLYMCFRKSWLLIFVFDILFVVWANSVLLLTVEAVPPIQLPHLEPAPVTQPRPSPAPIPPARTQAGVRRNMRSD